MEKQQPTLGEIIASPDFSPEELGARFWYEEYKKLAQKVLELDEELKKAEE
jgi:hypothetical protein